MDILNGGTVDERGGGIGVGTTADGVSSGTILVGGTGAAAFLNFSTSATGGLTIGNASRGTLIVADNGTINMNGTTWLTIGAANGASGAAFIGGSSVATVVNLGTGGVTVGSNGTGAVYVGNNGAMNLNGTGYFSLGANAGSSGMAVVAGATAAAVVNLATAGLNVGNNGTGALTVGDHGTIYLNGSGFLIVAANAGSQGTLFVGGGTSASVVNIANAGLTVGNGGTAAVTVGNLGTIDINGTLGIGVVVGQSAGATGTLMINGGTVNEAGHFSGVVVGSGTNAVGSATVTNGGLLTVDGGYIAMGALAGSSGTVTVGPGSTIMATGPAAMIDVGQSGNGVLNILNGATVSAAGMSIGQFSGGSGTVSLAGAGSLLDVSGAIFVGNSGAPSVLSIGPVVAGQVNVNGQVLIQGGVLDPSQILIDPGSGIAGFGQVGNAGDPIYNNSSIVAQPGALTGQTELTVIGAVSGFGSPLIEDGATLALQGGPVSNTQTVDFTGNSGTLFLGDPSEFQGIIGSFYTGDQIQVAGDVGSDLLQGNTLTLFGTNSTPLGSIAFGPNVDLAQVSVNGVSPAASVPDSWVSDQPGDFDDPTNGSVGVPGGTLAAVINFADAPVITHGSGNDTVNSLTNQDGTLMMLGGTLTAGTLNNGSNLTRAGGALSAASSRTAAR